MPANGTTPSYSLFHDAAMQLAQCLDTDGDVSLTTLSKTVYMILLTAVCPGRKRMLLYVRAADSDSFQADEDHGRDVLEALCAEHTKHLTPGIRPLCPVSHPTTTTLSGGRVAPYSETTLQLRTTRMIRTMARVKHTRKLIYRTTRAAGGPFCVLSGTTGIILP